MPRCAICRGLRDGQSAARRAACGMLCVTVGWWRQRGSNPRPAACDAATLPAELCPHMIGRSTEVSGAGAMIVAAGRKPAGAGGTAAVSVPGTLQDPCSPEVTLLRILYPTAAACGGRQRHMPLPPGPGGRCPGHARQDCRTARAGNLHAGPAKRRPVMHAPAARRTRLPRRRIYSARRAPCTCILPVCLQIISVHQHGNDIIRTAALSGSRECIIIRCSSGSRETRPS